MKSILIFLLFFGLGISNAQFAPSVGKEGTTAIGKDSSVFVNWGRSASIQRGFVDIGDKELGNVTQGNIDDVYGIADNKTISLGDGGQVIYRFDIPIINGDLWDFAVFENSFDDSFLELATVEVSSDGEHYSMFPPVSLTDTSVQIGTFGTLDATKIHNLAGKYRGGYGTPFDLDSLPDNNMLDKNNIRYIRIKDVVGSINAKYGRFDSRGVLINDPFPTPFESGGFDLDAIGVIHQRTMSIPRYDDKDRLILYPTQAVEQLTAIAKDCLDCMYEIFDYRGCKLLAGGITVYTTIRISELSQGMYLFVVYDKTGKIVVAKHFMKMY